MEDVRFIINKNNTQHLSESGGKFDQDKTVLTFEYYIRFLKRMGCKDISIVHSEDDTINIEKLSLDAKRIIGNRVYTHQDYKNDHQEIKTHTVAR